MSTLRKITVILPKSLLDDSLKATGKSLTETIRLALKQVALKNNYKKLRSLKSKVKFKLTADELRDLE
jgi:hypothetical protein